MVRYKKVFKSFRVILLIIFLLISIIAISPNPWASGVAIRSVQANSSASIAGIQNPQPNIMPMKRERIYQVEIDYKKHQISGVKDYFDATSNLDYNQTVRVFTNKNTYILKIKPITETIILDELEEKEIPLTREITEEVNGTNITRVEYVTEELTRTINISVLNKTSFESYQIPKEVTEMVNRTTTVLVNKTKINYLGVEDLGLNVYDAPETNLRKGLDLQGGTRVILEPEKLLSDDEMEILKLNMEKRLNVYGLSDIIVRVIRDKPAVIGGVPKFILVEIPGANEREVKDLLSKQGKFEAMIGNETVFKGGHDITYVCRSSECSGIDPSTGCGTTGGGWACRFRFSITLTPEAAERQAELTKNLAVVSQGRDQYLSEQLRLLLDDTEVDQLNIGSDLKGRAVTEISISGSGIGRTKQEAIIGSLDNMKKLQTVLITGSLPVKLNIIKTDNISPQLGDKFVKNAILVGILAVIAVSLVVFIRYRKLEVSVPILLTLISEVIMLLGLAAFIGWNLDIAAIAGIIIAAGTGVDHLIVISDEALKGFGGRVISWKEQLKRAFFIITASYFTTCVAMLPLLFAGAGLLKGFAFTTIAGVSFGVFIARPAYAKAIEILLK